MKTLPPPALEHLCDLVVEIGAALDVGQTAMGMRRVIPITGGTVTGPLLQGHILPGGADFQLIVDGGRQAHLDARYVLALQDGSCVFVHNTALRVASPDDAARLMRGEAVNPANVYFRCQPRFEASSARWAWLSEHQFVGVGSRLPDAVHLSFYVVR